uniref:Uncharacterized protein n=1 Tax=Faxonius propinquus nudivirus TaxID=3139431 RepID=A0AAU8GCY9_9VIRU
MITNIEIFLVVMIFILLIYILYMAYKYKTTQFKMTTLSNTKKISKKNIEQYIQDNNIISKIKESIDNDRNKSTKTVNLEVNISKNEIDLLLISEQNKEPQEPIIEPQEPIIEPQEPIIEPQEPIIEPQEPIIEPQEPIIEPQEPIIEPQEPIIEPRSLKHTSLESHEPSEKLNKEILQSFNNNLSNYENTNSDKKGYKREYLNISSLEYNKKKRKY